MTTEKTYEDYVIEAGEAKRDLDVVLTPIFRHLKAAFGLMFLNDGMSGTDFKRLSDMKYYQGGYPSQSSPPKEYAMAVAVANLLKMEEGLGTRNLASFLGALGIRVEVMNPISPNYTLSTEDEKKLRSAWEGAGIDREIPTDKPEALELMLDRAQNIQSEICESSDSFRVEAASEVEDKFKIKKPNFMKAVNLQAIKLKRGPGIMGEKLDDVVDDMENLDSALAPLMPK